MAGTCGSVTGGMVVLTSSCSSQNTQNWQELAKDQVLFYSRMKKSRKRTDYRKTSKPHDFNVRMAADQTNMDSRLIQAVIQIESAGDPDAVSSTGAIGLMQIMPETARELNINPHDPQENIIGGATYLSQMLKRFGRLELALAAYNAGPGAVNQYGGIPPYPETIRYVKNVIKTYDSLKNQL